ncbi:MAG: type II toxin-antitoxin system RelE/ParE family toxin [Pirellulales bacterium]|nr:type II toxin-antitoxin system RelE/ParE family toxin [Pirellulales bacterium]
MSKARFTPVAKNDLNHHARFIETNNRRAAERFLDAAREAANLPPKSLAGPLGIAPASRIPLPCEVLRVARSWPNPQMDGRRRWCEPGRLF